MERDIITIDEEKCNGCGDCVPGCPEGAIQIIDGKARLVSDLFCDGLGACIGECPAGALKVERREAEPYDEKKVMENVARGGPNVIRAHLRHLREHGEQDFLDTALDWLKSRRLPIPAYEDPKAYACPGQKIRVLSPSADEEIEAEENEADRPSALRNWPIQLALNNPDAPHFRDADILLAADCTAFAYRPFHGSFLKGKALLILCPKLDDRNTAYREKLVRLLKNGVRSVTVLRMVVPCCGIDILLEQAVREAGVEVPVSVKTVSLEGNLME